MAIKIQLRRGTAAEWTSANPVLMQGEMGVETDTLKVKIGNGSTAWATLPYFTQGAKGDKGDQGIQGIQGVIGNTGPTGPVGPANTLTVGAVTSGIEGSDAEVTITGTSPNQVMNLVIPRGDKGDAATIAVGTVTSVAAGQPAKVTNAGTSAAAVLNFEIPNAVGVPTGGSSGQVVRKTASATEWASLSTSDLGDVAISAPSNGQALTYDSATSKWKNATPAANLSQLGDVAVSSPADKQVLQYESASGKWKNKQATGGVSVSDTTPASPIDGDALFYSADGTMFVRYNDGTSVQWVQPNAVLSSQIEQRYYSPNYIINGGFDIWQRGTSSTANAAYCADRWWIYYNAGTTTFSRETSVVPSGLANALKMSQASANAGMVVYQFVETQNTRLLAGKTVTFSAYIAATAAVTVTPEISWSTTVDAGYAASWTTLTPSVSSWDVSSGSTYARFSATCTIPANAQTIKVGVVTNVTVGNSVYLAGLQLEAGSTATPFRRNANSVQGELAACQRYFYASASNQLIARSGGLTHSFLNTVELPVSMRIVPTVTFYSLENWAGTTGKVTSWTGGVGSDRTPAIHMPNTSSLSIYLPSYNASEFTQFAFLASAEL